MALRIGAKSRTWNDAITSRLVRWPQSQPPPCVGHIAKDRERIDAQRGVSGEQSAQARGHVSSHDDGDTEGGVEDPSFAYMNASRRISSLDSPTIALRQSTSRLMLGLARGS